MPTEKSLLPLIEDYKRCLFSSSMVHPSSPWMETGAIFWFIAITR